MIEDARSLDEAISRLKGPIAKVMESSPVHGGCIANGSRILLTDGTILFAKQAPTLTREVFRAEARGLVALRCDDGPRIPEPLAVGATEHMPFILTEWIEAARPKRGFHRLFGRLLARMHRSLTSVRFGFGSDNFIGSTEQPNEWMESWLDFFGARRIGFQTRLARNQGRIDSSLADSLDSIVNRLDSLLIEPIHPSLLHGDLWGGNYLSDETGLPVLIDPAVYYGHPEADLALTELFGGFSDEFYSAYREESPLQPGYGERRDLYNLYHLLNHLNIFGGSYLGSVRSIVLRYR